VAPIQSDQPPDTDDVVLVDRIIAGSEPAAETLVRRHGGWMLSVAQRYMRDRSMAEDCVQEAFINAFTRLQSFERRSSLKSWLHRIVINQSLMKLRAQRARNEKDVDELLPEFDANACRIEQPWRQILTPEQIVGANHLRTLVLAKIDELPDIYRNVLLLRDIEELSTSEVAQTLELTEANVKVRLHRARSALKHLLEPILRGEEP
jgi:RNA polymerase sigma-70 factor (ECF subfamily)